MNYYRSTWDSASNWDDAIGALMCRLSCGHKGFPNPFLTPGSKEMECRAVTKLYRKWINVDRANLLKDFSGETDSTVLEIG